MGKKFKAEHQALVMGWIARNVFNSIGDNEGERLVRKAMVKYGMQRGRRMALRAEANGHPLTMDTYLAYGEWFAPKDEWVVSVVEKGLHVRAKVLKCPWQDTWKANDLVPFGRYLCMEVDTALLRGYNDKLVLDVNGTMANGALCCEFNFRNVNLTPLKMLKLLWRKAVNPGKRAVMSWEYHTGHMFWTMERLIREELGNRTDDIIKDALDNFSKRYGEEATGIVLGYRDTDFDRLP